MPFQGRQEFTFSWSYLSACSWLESGECPVEGNCLTCQNQADWQLGIGWISHGISPFPSNLYAVQWEGRKLEWNECIALSHHVTFLCDLPILPYHRHSSLKLLVLRAHLYSLLWTSPGKWTFPFHVHSFSLLVSPIILQKLGAHSFVQVSYNVIQTWTFPPYKGPCTQL